MLASDVTMDYVVSKTSFQHFTPSARKSLTYPLHTPMVSASVLHRVQTHVPYNVPAWKWAWETHPCFLSCPNGGFRRITRKLPVKNPLLTVSKHKKHTLIQRIAQYVRLLYKVLPFPSRLWNTGLLNVRYIVYGYFSSQVFLIPRENGLQTCPDCKYMFMFIPSILWLVNLTFKLIYELSQVLFSTNHRWGRSPIHINVSAVLHKNARTFIYQRFVLYRLRRWHGKICRRYKSFRFFKHRRRRKPEG